MGKYDGYIKKVTEEDVTAFRTIREMIKQFDRKKDTADVKKDTTDVVFYKDLKKQIGDIKVVTEDNTFKTIREMIITFDPKKESTNVKKDTTDIKVFKVFKDKNAKNNT